MILKTGHCTSSIIVCSLRLCRSLGGVLGLEGRWGSEAGREVGWVGREAGCVGREGWEEKVWAGSPDWAESKGWEENWLENGRDAFEKGRDGFEKGRDWFEKGAWEEGRGGCEVGTGGG